MTKPQQLVKAEELINFVEATFQQYATLSKCRFTEWPIKQLRLLLEGCFDHSKYKIGDWVFLTKTLEITEDKSPGYMPYKHFLIEGAIAYVEDVVLRENKGFYYALSFVGHSWVSAKGVVHPQPFNGQFHFSEASLAPIHCSGLIPAFCPCDSCKYDAKKYDPKRYAAPAPVVTACPVCGKE